MFVLRRLRPNVSRRQYQCGSYFLSSQRIQNLDGRSSFNSSNSFESTKSDRISNRGHFTSQFSTSSRREAVSARVAMSAQESESLVKEFRRLPKTAVPSHYSLTLKPNIGDFTFEGSQQIKINVSATSNEILLNAAELKVSDVVWEYSGSGSQQKPTTVVLDEKNELLRISFDPALTAGEGTLRMSFTGTLNDKMKGFYRSKYKSPSGEERYNAVTQFEATDARRCFPCWDEPAIKATFDVTLVAPKDRVALSNMPIKSTTPHPSDNNLLVHAYETSPIMSTYLLAFIVGEFDYIEATSSDGVLCRVYTPLGKKEQGKFALDITVRVLPYYSDYFGIPYPLPKMDLIAIADFSAGAMENWGLVTYRETALLEKGKDSSASSRQWIAIVVGHEIAHQWFGNLVTMEWWTHLWLNEGYASFVEYLSVDHLLPEYDIWTQFVTDSHIRALELDSLKNSHPIEVPVNHPSEIDEIFDDISYSKGASIIRMLYHFIGDAAFKKGMNIYLTRHKYGNTFTEDLWNALSEASSKPVSEVMTTWTKQMGYPVIKVNEVKQIGNDHVLSLTQEKFWADPEMKNDKSNENYLWMVPLNFSASSNPSKSVQDILMDSKSLSVTIPGTGTAQWIKVNPGTVGFYRVQYPPSILANFIPAIQSKEMPPLDRLGLLDDLFALVQAGQASTVDVLNLLPAFVNEDNYTVFASISSILGKLNLLMGYSSSHAEFKAFGRKIFRKIEEQLGWDAKPNENHLHALLRSLVLNRMASFDDEPTRKEAQRRFELHVSGKELIPADLRSAVYKAVMSGTDEQSFQALLKMFRETDDQEEKERIQRSWGASKDLTILKKVLDLSISDEVRTGETVFVICAAGMSKDGRELVWEFFKENWKLFAERYPSGSHVARIMKNTFEHFVTEEKAFEVEAFFREHPFPGTERTVQQVIEAIRLNEAWLKRDLGHIQNHLASTAELTAA